MPTTPQNTKHRKPTEYASHAFALGHEVRYLGEGEHVDKVEEELKRCCPGRVRVTDNGGWCCGYQFSSTPCTTVVSFQSTEE
jgi:hypothetical protein